MDASLQHLTTLAAGVTLDFICHFEGQAVKIHPLPDFVFYRDMACML